MRNVQNHNQARSLDFALGEGGSCVGGRGAEPPAAENFCIFYLKKVNFSAFNCTICCNNV